ncbi:DNA polymerase III subunit beta [Candidatus Wolfebacteria bacterium]|nr:MAG: DNA polymerase III subunit beta [Candidatus Wolfebacteria bacterium]
MKVECSIEKLKNAISQADRITGKNLSLPILSSVLLIATDKKLKIRATNLSLGIEIEIPAKVEKEGVAALQGSVVSNIFSSINQNENVYLELINDNLSIQTSNNSILVKNYPHDDFPTIPMVTGTSITIPANKFIDGMKSVFYSAAVSDIKPEISSVYIYSEEDFLVFVSTDSFRLAEKKIPVKKIGEFKNIIIPFKNIPEIIRLFDNMQSDLEITFSENQISFSGNGIYLSSRIIDGVFPDYKQIIPKTHTTEAIVLKTDLLNALKLSNIFSDKFNQITLRVKPVEKLFELQSKNADVGENNTQVSAALTGDDIDVSFNFKYFMDAFQSLPHDSIIINLNGENKPLVIKGQSDNSFTYLIMPMNR